MPPGPTPTVERLPGPAPAVPVPGIDRPSTGPASLVEPDAGQAPPLGAAISPPSPPQGGAYGSSRAEGGESAPRCTAAQLRRFIKSRAYVPLHELRRRFALPGSEDEVNPLVVDGRHLFVGLPPREATLLGELLGSRDVGYELLLDPACPLIIGLFPMRPVPRS